MIHSQKICLQIYTCIYHTWKSKIAGEGVLDSFELPVGPFFTWRAISEGLVVSLPIGTFSTCIELMNVYTSTYINVLIIKKKKKNSNPNQL
jgi:hypothetical protein